MIRGPPPGGARGTYYVAQPAGGAFGNSERAVATIEQKLASNPAVYGKVMTVDFNKDHYQLAPAAARASFFQALKPGGILGFEDHRGRADVPQDPTAKGGYMRQDYMIDMAKKGRLRARRILRDGCQSAGHRGLSAGRVDFATDPRAGCPGL